MKPRPGSVGVIVHNVLGQEVQNLNDDDMTGDKEDQVDKEATLNTAQERADQSRALQKYKYLDAAVSRTATVNRMIEFFENLQVQFPRGSPGLYDIMNSVQTHLEVYETQTPVAVFDDVDFSRDSDAEDDVQIMTVPESIHIPVPLKRWIPPEIVRRQTCFVFFLNKMITVHAVLFGRYNNIRVT